MSANQSTIQRPKIICLCGSTKFWREFQRQSLRLTMEGVIVLSIGAASGTDDEHFGNLPKAEYDAVKERLDQLHLRKIEMADEVLILNEGGHIGESTAREILHAIDLGKAVRWLEPVAPRLLMTERRPLPLPQVAAAAAPQLLAALENLLENTERPPERNCACHISPPCGDCVDYASIREAIQNAEEAIAKAEGRAGE